MTSRKDVAERIQRKWDDLAASRDGRFTRFLDGNPLNTDPSNTDDVHPFDAFSAMFHGQEWTTDMMAGLTSDEEAFVRDNVWNFCVTYQASGRTPAEPPIDRSMCEGEEDPEVVALTEQGDAAMAAGAFERAVELYNAAKAAREGTSDALTDFMASQPSKSSSMDRRGRQGGGVMLLAADRESIVSSQPSNRILAQQGGRSRKEEVAARVASRK